jgi:hypothetical protein
MSESMAGRGELDGPKGPDGSGRESDATSGDYTGAVYGSLLAASVVATAGSLGPEFSRVRLALLLIVTGLVFWAAHVYARLAGERLAHGRATWHTVGRVARAEWSLVEAALLPAAAVLISPLFGLGPVGAAWLALGVAVGQQTAWAVWGALRAGASWQLASVEGVVNLVLGLVIVAAKAAVGH